MSLPALNRHGGPPLYRQVGDLLVRRISVGEYGPDDRLPTEAELAATYEVNRLTVRQALAELARRGVVRTVHGRGSFVARPPIRHEVGPGHQASLTRAMRAAGRTVTQRLLRVAVEDAAGPREQLGTGGTVHRYELLRLVDDAPWSLTTTWLGEERLPGVTARWRGDTSLYDMLEREYGIALRRSSRTFAAAPAGAVEAGQLLVPAGSPLLHIRGLNTTPTGEPVAYVEHAYRGDRAEFTVELR